MSLEPVSIVINNFNGETTLPETLESIKAIDYPIAEVLLVDDGSTDRGVDAAIAAYPPLRLIRLRRNTQRLNIVRNTGLKNAASELVFLIDNDIIIHPHCIRKLVEAHHRFANAAICAPRLIYANDHNKIYMDGQQFHYLGQTIARNREGAADVHSEILVGSTGCGIMLIDKKKAETISYFDEDYRLGWGDDGEFYYRIRLAGFETYQVPEAICYHHPKQRTTQRAYAQIYNRWLLILSVYSGRSLFILGPVLAFYEAILFLTVAAKGAGSDYFRAFGELSLSEILKRRNRIQKSRKLLDRQIFHSGKIYVAPSLLNNFFMRAGLSVSNLIFKGYWLAVRRWIK
jgi:GT2 family glycosyltransferase